MSLPLAFHAQVRDEVDEAYAWYQQRAGLGEDFLSAVQEVLDRIQQNPQMYGVVYRDVRRGLLRRFPYGVFYRVETNRVLILAVYHSRRDPQGWQSRA